MPQRIQRKRVKGWRKPDGVIYVGRGSGWGNPYSIVKKYGYWHLYTGKYLIGPYETRERAVQEAIERFREYAVKEMKRDREWLKPLRDKDLMCWCGDGPCHADVLIELANR